MPIYYPPEYLQQAVTGPNPTPNIGGAFDAFFKMANDRQQSAQETLKMLLQSVPETGGQRAQVAGAIAQDPEAMGAMDPDQVRMFPKRGAKTPTQAVTGAFNKAYGALPNRPQYDPAQLRESINALSKAAQDSGIDVDPNTLRTWAGQMASGQMPQEPEFFSLMAHPQAKHLGLETLYTDLIQEKARKEGKVLTPQDLLAARQEWAKVSSDPQQMALLRTQIMQQALELGQQRLIQLQEQNKAFSKGAILSPGDQKRYESDAATLTARVAATRALIKDFDAAAQGDAKATNNILMTLGTLASRGDDSQRQLYTVLMDAAINKQFTPEMRAILQHDLETTQATLDATNQALKSKRAAPPTEGDVAPADPDDALADELLKQLTAKP